MYAGNISHLPRHATDNNYPSHEMNTQRLIHSAHLACSNWRSCIWILRTTTRSDSSCTSSSFCVAAAAPAMAGEGERGVGVLSDAPQTTRPHSLVVGLLTDRCHWSGRRARRQLRGLSVSAQRRCGHLSGTGGGAWDWNWMERVYETHISRSFETRGNAYIGSRLPVSAGCCLLPISR